MGRIWATTSQPSPKQAERDTNFGGGGGDRSRRPGPLGAGVAEAGSKEKLIAIAPQFDAFLARVVTRAGIPLR